MKHRVWALLLLLVSTLAMASAAQAERPWYFGIKAGQASLDLPQFDDLVQGGVLVGYRFWSHGNGGTLAVEAEYTDTLAEGDFEIEDGFGADWEARTLAAYIAYRSGGRFFFKAKAGYQNIDFQANATAFGFNLELNSSEDDASAGLGFGWRFGRNMGLELEWSRTFFDADFDLITLAFTF